MGVASRAFVQIQVEAYMLTLWTSTRCKKQRITCEAYKDMPVNTCARCTSSNSLATETLVLEVGDIPRPQTGTAQHNTSAEFHCATNGTDFLRIIYISEMTSEVEKVRG